MNALKEKLRQHWQWLLVFGASILATFAWVLFGKEIFQPKPASDVQKAEDEKLEQRVDEARVVEQTTIAQAQAEHDAAVTKVEEDLQANVVAIENDPLSVNAFLRDAGKRARGN